MTTLPAVDPGFRGDANETLVFARQLEYFFSKVYEFEYPEAMGRKIVPIDTSVPSGAEAHIYRMTDELGEARVIDSYADDLPLVDAYGQEHAEKIVGLAAAFMISIQDLRRAAMAGIPLDTKKANIARRVMERKLDMLLATGDSKTGMIGFANNSEVPTAAGVSLGLTGSWGTATAAQIQADVEKIGAQVFKQTKGIHGNPDNGSKLTLAVDTDSYARLASLRIDTFNMMTVLEYIKTKNPFIADVVSWSRLNKANAGGNGPRIVAYDKNPDVLSGVLSQDFEMLPMQPKALSYLVPCHMRFGGTIYRYPLAALYADGV
jgi:hypothetical protein